MTDAVDDARMLREYAGRKVTDEMCKDTWCVLPRESVMCEYCAAHCMDVDCRVHRNKPKKVPMALGALR